MEKPISDLDEIEQDDAIDVLNNDPTENDNYRIDDYIQHDKIF